MAPVIKAEIALVSLRSCMVNLPPNLITLLSNANTPPQNVIVELQYRSQTLSAGAVSSPHNAGFQRSAYVGWTGMPSGSRPSSSINERARGGRDQVTPLVEVDSAFAKVLGLVEGAKIGLLVHLNPAVTHTVNIEPLTPADWDIIELHATFLELNLLSQIRALPNPLFKDAAQTQVEQSHPLTLHLSPNTTANIIVTSLTPALSPAFPFSKLAPDAEVIVAPKTRSRAPKSNKDARSIISRRSGRSGVSTRTATAKKYGLGRQPVFLRGTDAGVARAFFHQSEVESLQHNLALWISKSALSSEELRNASFASVSIVRPTGLRAILDQTQLERLKEEEGGEAGRPAANIVARLSPWENPVDEHQAVLTSKLSQMLGADGMSGLILRVEAADPPLPRQSLRSISFFPFLASNVKNNDGLKFGGDTKARKQAIMDRLKIAHGGTDGLLSGPLTDGMVLPPVAHTATTSSFDGGILRLQVAAEAEQLLGSQQVWILGGEHRPDYEIRNEVPSPLGLTTLFPFFSHSLPVAGSELTGADTIIKQCMSNLTLCSSVLLTGSIGSGKSAIACHLGDSLRRHYMFNVNYVSCQKLVTDEIRVSTIKDTWTRLFMSAAFCARLGGQSLVILDDLDKICPAETELQVGNDNGRSRQVTEVLCAIIRQYCSLSSGVVLLATAQSKDSLNSILIGGHVIGDILSLKSPSKETRRDLLAQFLSNNKNDAQANGQLAHSRQSSDAQSMSGDAWMNPSNPSTRPGSSSSSQVDGFHPSPSLDLLDIAGKTDGYMPADLKLLVSRARNECLIRNISSTAADQDTATELILNKFDFDSALRNFTPVSLRNVTLTHSSTTFSSVGGLKVTRDTLLETLLYPTKYAPIFKASPLRLRSGLLLYGFPGCGKTLLASAVAGECGLNFISVKGPEILNKYIGASEKSVRDLFERAQAAKPCVLFFDEFDSIAPKRGHDSTGVTDRVVNQMLTQMDGAEGLDGVYVLAATSRPDLIDPALLRPGRLDKSLLCDMPNQEDREDILRAVSEKLSLTTEVSSRLGDIAARTEGYSGADLQALMYNSHLEAIHDLLGDQNGNIDTKKMGSQHMNGHGPVPKPHASQSSKLSSKARRSEAKKDDFIQFIYSPDLDAEARKPTAAHLEVSLDSRMVIASRLEEMKLSRKKEKALLYNTQHAGQLQNPSLNKDAAGKENGKGGDEVLIRWSHVEKSLATTRSSISPQERRRLQAIYREFVVGRNGEMPNGDGSREIGGRTSLM